MGKLVYSAIASLDGYVADAKGSFDWAAPDEEVHGFVNDLERQTGLYLCGRRLYEVMSFWNEDPPADWPSYTKDFAAIWQAAEKIVYSRTLTGVSAPRTRLERDFDAGAVRALKERAERDLVIGGPGLAAEALRAGLVDEYQVFVAPAIVGGGKRALPDDVGIDLELLDERRFRSGFVYLRYRLRA